MLARPPSSSARRSRIIAAGLLTLLCATAAPAARRHAEVSPFERAQQMRDALEARPALQTTAVNFHPQAQHGFLHFDGSRAEPDRLASQVAWPATIAFYRATLLEGQD